MTRMISISLASLALVPLPARSETVRGYRPVPPHLLITELPDAPENWRMVQSRAETRFGEWLETFAIRVFEKVTPPPGDKPTPRTTISILDAALFPGSTAMFDDFQPGQEKNYEQRIVRHCPAFLIPLNEREHETILLVGERFLVTVFSENQTERMRQKWLETLDLSSLEEIPRGDSIDLPETIQVVEIDQLNPKRNRTYPLAISTDDEPGEDDGSDE